jgi:hypothetical protein
MRSSSVKIKTGGFVGRDEEKSLTLSTKNTAQKDRKASGPREERWLNFAEKGNIYVAEASKIPENPG